MTTSATAGQGPRPGDDPTEYNWPDDAKELRQAERDAARKRATIKPAPRALVAYLLGTWTVLVFVTVFSLFQGGVELTLGVAFPIALAGLVGALPVGLILERLTRGRGYGIPTVVVMVAGGFIGYGWTHAFVGWMRPQMEEYWVNGGASFEAGYAAQFTGIQQAMSTFMMTAVASAFVVALMVTGKARMLPKVMYASAVGLAVLVIPSAVAIVSYVRAT